MMADRLNSSPEVESSVAESRQLEMDVLVGADGVDEFTVYVAPVGKKIDGGETSWNAHMRASLG